MKGSLNRLKDDPSTCQCVTNFQTELTVLASQVLLLVACCAKHSSVETLPESLRSHRHIAKEELGWRQKSFFPATHKASVACMPFGNSQAVGWKAHVSPLDCHAGSSWAFELSAAVPPSSSSPSPTQACRCQLALLMLSIKRVVSRCGQLHAWRLPA